MATTQINFIDNRPAPWRNSAVDGDPEAEKGHIAIARLVSQANWDRYELRGENRVAINTVSFIRMSQGALSASCMLQLELDDDRPVWVNP